jgi:glutathione S-transferase
MALKLFELVGTDAERPFSPFCWRTRMALAHKGLGAESISVVLYREGRDRAA